MSCGTQGDFRLFVRPYVRAPPPSLKARIPVWRRNPSLKAQIPLTDRQTNERKSPFVLQDIVPFGAAAQKGCLSNLAGAVMQKSRINTEKS